MGIILKILWINKQTNIYAVNHHSVEVGTESPVKITLITNIDVPIGYDTTLDKNTTCFKFDDYGGAFGKADVIGCFLNLDDLEIRFAKNGVDLGRAFSINQQFKNNPFFPAVVLKNAEMQFNFGETPFKYPPTHGENYL